MPYNVTVDDIYPLITYKGQWQESHELVSDLKKVHYLGGTFHTTQGGGSTASFSFNGTAVYIFGAKRSNHGYYNVTIDGNQAERFDGQAGGTGEVYQVPLYRKTDLADGMHTVVLSNDPDAGTVSAVDIDFITWTSSDIAGTSNQTIDDSDGAFTYKSPGVAWSTSTMYSSDHYGGTEHATNTNQANASLLFEGSGIYLYGGTLHDHGGFSVQIDAGFPVSLNGSTSGYHSGVLLYYADGLGVGKHTLTVTNTEAGRWLDIDYVDVIQSNFSETPESNGGTGSRQDGKSKTPIIAGLTCAVIILAALAIAAVWYFKRMRKRESQGADLINAEAKPYDVQPTGYGPASAGPGWHRRSQRGGDPWANDPVFVGVEMVSYTNAHTGRVVPPRNIKGRPPVVQQTQARAERSGDELRVSRMRVPDQPQDRDPVENQNETESSGILPPHYNQAIEHTTPL